MLLALPITNVRLAACAVPPDTLTPVAGGHFCASCQRLVHDFTQASAAELAAARAASPDGRLCGRFRPAQLSYRSRPPRLRSRLRGFLVALVLILVQGLTAQQAWAQVKRPGRPPAAKTTTRPQPVIETELLGDVEALLEPEPPVKSPLYRYAERTPEPPGGTEAYLRALGKQLRRPAGPRLQGKVFVTFIVQPDGQLSDLRVSRGLSPTYDAEALRVVQLLQPWTPGSVNGRAVPVSYTQVVTFGKAEK